MNPLGAWRCPPDAKKLSTDVADQHCQWLLRRTRAWAGVSKVDTGRDRQRYHWSMSTRAGDRATPAPRVSGLARARAYCSVITGFLLAGVDLLHNLGFRLQAPWVGKHLGAPTLLVECCSRADDMASHDAQLIACTFPEKQTETHELGSISTRLSCFPNCVARRKTSKRTRRQAREQTSRPIQVAYVRDVGMTTSPRAGLR